MEPFDEARYRALMDGHECTEIMFSQLDRTHRLDSEFYRKKSLKIVETLDSIKAKPLTDGLVSVSDGNHMGISDKFQEKGIPYYRGQDIHNFFIEDADPICIDEDTFNSAYMLRSHLQKNDILLSIVGTIGEVALVSGEDKATCNCKLAILRPANEKKAALTAIYLKTKYGFDQIDKFKRGTVQMGYLLEDISQILIPDFTVELENEVAKAIDAVKELKNRSNRQYELAGKFLLDEMGIDMSSLSSSGISVGSFAESLSRTGRLDAEYYQLKYKELIGRMHTSGTIGSVCNLYDQTYMPDKNTFYPYIELANIGKSGEIKDVSTIIGEELPTRARRRVRKGQVIVSSIEGSLDSCAIVTDKFDGALCSTGFYVIDSNSYNSETLFLLLKSKPIQSLLKRGCSGTILTNITKEEFLDIPLPYVGSDVQCEIKNMVTKTYSLREKSKRLLECARQAVEMAVEQEETAAVAWLNGKIDELTSEE